MQGRTDFSLFYIVGSKRRKGYEKKKCNLRKAEKTGFLKVQFFIKKYAFLPGVKNCRKRMKIRTFVNGFHLGIANAPREIDPRC